MYELFDDDITFCASQCDYTDCFRHPSNIKHPEFPVSFAFFDGTDSCNRPDVYADDDDPCITCSEREYCDGWDAQFCCTRCMWLYDYDYDEDYAMCEECDPMDI